jgi:hypothetical protein
MTAEDRMTRWLALALLGTLLSVAETADAAHVIRPAHPARTAPAVLPEGLDVNLQGSGLISGPTSRKDPTASGLSVETARHPHVAAGPLRSAVHRTRARHARHKA